MQEQEAKKTRNKKIFIDYLPAIVNLLLAIVTLILYSTVITTRKGSAYFSVVFITIVAFAFIFAVRKWKLGIPRYIIILTCLHFVLAVYLGTAMGMYKKLFWWDLFTHGYFGFLCCAIVYYLYVNFEKKEPKWIQYVIFMLLTIAFAALWEIYEYVADLFLHSDMQGVESAIEKGISPLTDTMTDMIIAIAGGLVFYLALWIKKALKKAQKSADAEQNIDN